MATEVAASGKTFTVKIKRQMSPDVPAVTETFAIPYRRNMNITSVLGEIALKPEHGRWQANDADCV